MLGCMPTPTPTPTPFYTHIHPRHTPTPTPEHPYHGYIIDKKKALPSNFFLQKSGQIRPTYGCFWCFFRMAIHLYLGVLKNKIIYSSAIKKHLKIRCLRCIFDKSIHLEERCLKKVYNICFFFSNTPFIWVF